MNLIDYEPNFILTVVAIFQLSSIFLISALSGEWLYFFGSALFWSAIYSAGFMIAYRSYKKDEGKRERKEAA